MASTAKVTPSAAEILLGLATALEWAAEQDERRLEKTWWAERRMNMKVGSDDVAMALGLFEIYETESRWCEGCGKLEHKATHYRSVSSGVVSAIGRVLGQLVKQGFVARDERYPSRYTLSAGGAALVDDAQELALAHIREAVG